MTPTARSLITTPILSATKRDTLAVDADSNGMPSPGDTLRYEIILRNTGNSVATGVSFSDTPDANTGLITGTVQTSQGAVTVGNGTNDSQIAVDVGTILTGGSVTISFQVTINNALPAGVTHAENQGLVSGRNIPYTVTDDPDTAQTSDPTRTPLTADPIINSTKQDSLLVDADNNGVVSLGDTLLYRIIVANTGNAGATDVVFNDTPDANTTLINGSVQTSQGTVTTGNNEGDTAIAVNISDLPAGSSVTISFHVTINNPLPAGVTEIYNQGVVTSIELPPVGTDDPETGQEEDDTVLPVVPMPGLLVDKVMGSNNPAYVTELVTFTIYITNTGNTRLTNVPLTDTFDSAHLTFVSAVPMPDMENSTATTDTGTLVWRDLTAFFGDIGPDAGISVRVVMLATNITPDGVRAENSATVANALDEFNLVPPTGNDHDMVTLEVLPHIALTKILDTPGPVTVGDEITFTIRITNTGTTTIVTLPLSDTYNAAYIGYVRSIPPPDRFTAGMVEWDNLTVPLGNLAARQGITVTVVFTAVAPITQTVNHAIVFATLDNLGHGLGSGGAAEAEIIIRDTPAAVTLRSFQAVAYGAATLRIEWVTGVEIDTWGFHLWRSATGSRDDAQRITAAMLPATGGPTQGSTYSVLDNSVQPGVYYTYWLQEIEMSGKQMDYGPITGSLNSGPLTGEEPAGIKPLFLPIIGAGCNG